MCLVGQPVIGAGAKVIEEIIKLSKRLPPLDPTGRGELGGDQIFEIGYPFGFPDLVGEADGPTAAARRARSQCAPGSLVP
jgi:hypothetical protein